MAALWGKTPTPLETHAGGFTHSQAVGAFQEACGEAQRTTLDYLSFLSALNCVASQKGTSMHGLLTGAAAGDSIKEQQVRSKLNGGFACSGRVHV